MISRFHCTFLEHLNGRHIRYLIVGGQAAHFYHGSSTKDLDLWVSSEPNEVLALNEALILWLKEYPSHMHPMRRFSLEQGGAWEQIKIPDCEVAVLDEKGELQYVHPNEGIDILSKLKQASFSTCYKHRKTACINGTDVSFLSKADLEVTKKGAG